MIKTIQSSKQFIKGLQEWFDPAIEGNPYVRRENHEVRIKMTLDGVAKKTVYIVR